MKIKKCKRIMLVALCAAMLFTVCGASCTGFQIKNNSAESSKAEEQSVTESTEEKSAESADESTDESTEEKSVESADQSKDESSAKSSVAEESKTEQESSDSSKVNTQYTAVDLIDMTVPEIIELMGGEFEVSYTLPVQIYFYNDDVFPGMGFWIEFHDVNSLEVKDDEILVKGKNIKDEIKAGKYTLSDISVKIGKVMKEMTGDMTYNEVADIIGDFSVEVGRPPHLGGTLPALGITLKYLYKTDGKIIEFHFSNKDIVKDVHDENGQRVFTADEVRKVNPELFGVYVYKDPENESDTDISSTDWKTLYKDYLNDKLSSSDYTEQMAFDLYDVDEDGIPELFTTSSSANAAMGYNVYTVFNGEIKDITFKPDYGMVSVNSEKHCAGYIYQHNGYHTHIIYEKTGDQFKKIINASSNYGAVEADDPELYYMLDGKEVSKDEYDDTLKEYVDLTWDTVGRKYKLDSSAINTAIDDWGSE